MKKIYTVIATLFFLKSSFATTHVIEIVDNQFLPATITMVVGDTIQWKWKGDIHTTTSTDIPNGAAPWNSAVHNKGYTFKYKVTVIGTYNYKCKIHAPLGMVGTIMVTSALPVVLNNFGISPTNTHGALIAWSTATEINTDHFEIMRSTDDKNFEKITSIPAAGNSSSIHNYSYTDNAIPASYHYTYYYLSIIDKDGKKTLSQIKMFANLNGKPKLIESLSPNPISRPGHLMLQFNAEKEGSMHVQLYNASGKLVKEADLSGTIGLNNGHFHVGDVPAGVYTIIFSMDNLKESYKVVVQ
jgi:plastocyanin